jgi:hypothetical protein
MPVDPNNPLLLKELDPAVFQARATDISLKVDPETKTPLTIGPNGLNVGLPNSELIPDFWRDLSGQRANETTDTTDQIAHVGRAIVGANVPAVPSILEVTAPATAAADPAIGATGKIRFASYGQAALEGADLSKNFSGYVAGFADDGTIIEVPSSGGGVASGQVWSYVGAAANNLLGFNNFQVRFGGAIAAAPTAQIRCLTGTEIVEIFRTNLWGGGAVETSNHSALTLNQSWFTMDAFTLVDGSDRIAITITPSAIADGRWYDVLMWQPSPQKICLHARSMVA